MIVLKDGTQAVCPSGLSHPAGFLQPTWTITSAFPDAAKARQTLSVPSGYFFLKIIDSANEYISKVYVNYGLADETNEFPSAQGTLTPIGYYYAHANTIVRVEGQQQHIWTFNLNLPFTINQVATVVLK